MKKGLRKTFPFVQTQLLISISYYNKDFISHQPTPTEEEENERGGDQEEKEPNSKKTKKKIVHTLLDEEKSIKCKTTKKYRKKHMR